MNAIRYHGANEPLAFEQIQIPNDLGVNDVLVRSVVSHRIAALLQWDTSIRSEARDFGT